MAGGDPTGSTEENTAVVGEGSAELDRERDRDRDEDATRLRGGGGHGAQRELVTMSGLCNQGALGCLFNSGVCW